MILLAGLAAYSNSFAGVFVFDDEPAITQNPHLRALWPPGAAMRAPAGTTLSGRPVAALSFAVDYAVTDGSLAGYHATNLGIHLAAALLLFGITRRTLLTAPLRDRFGAGSTPLALLVALLFVVHPLQTASVTYIVQRVESLMGLFYLTTAYCAIRALDSNAGTRMWWTGAAAIACALGMGTKEVMATAPVMVMLWDHQFARDRTVSRRALYLSLASTWVILGLLVAGAHRTSAAGFGFAEWPWWRYLATQAGVVTHYLRLTVVPAPLVLDYDWPPVASLAGAALPAVLMCALIAATVWGSIRRAPAAFAGAWWFLILAPTSSVLPIVTEVAAEHRVYLPIAGAIALVVLGACEAGRRLAGDRAANQRRVRRVLILCGATAVTLLAIATHQRNADYHDYDRIWLDTIVRQPHNERARNNYATALLTSGRFAEAEPHLRAAVQEDPSFAEAHANLGVALAAQGRLDEGVAHLERAIAIRPDYAGARRNLGEAYARQQRLGEASAEFTRALALRPDDVSLLNRSAWILATARNERARDGARALTLARRAVELTGRQDADSLDSLAAALAEQGAFVDAAATAREGARLAAANGDRQLAAALEHRAMLYSRGQRFRE